MVPGTKEIDDFKGSGSLRQRKLTIFKVVGPGTKEIEDSKGSGSLGQRKLKILQVAGP